MTTLEKWLTAVMVLTATVGTVWYVAIELQRSNSLSAVGWSLVAFIWYIIIRRLLLLRAAARRRWHKDDDV